MVSEEGPAADNVANVVVQSDMSSIERVSDSLHRTGEDVCTT